MRAAPVQSRAVEEQHEFGFATRAIHAGQRPDPETGARAMPIYATTSFVFEDAQHAADLFALQNWGNIYTRIGNPTNAAFEERLASLEGGLGAVATGSGQAAQLIAVLTTASAGDHIVAARNLYGGTYTQFDVTLRKMGISVDFVDPASPEAFDRAVSERTKLIYGETIGNPPATCSTSRPSPRWPIRHDIPLMIDNTFATPFLCRPMMGGRHRGPLGHQVHWRSRRRHRRRDRRVGTFPLGQRQVRRPHRAITRLPRPPLLGKLPRVRVAEQGAGGVARDVGAALSPFNAFLLLLGLETLPLRMQAHTSNARIVAEHLAEHPAVTWVSYPIFDDSPTRHLAEKYTPGGPGAVFTFGLTGGFDAGVRFIESVELASHLANVGDAKTLVIHPASTTHQQVHPRAGPHRE